MAKKTNSSSSATTKNPVKTKNDSKKSSVSEKGKLGNGGNKSQKFSPAPSNGVAKVKGNSVSKGDKKSIKIAEVSEDDSDLGSSDEFDDDENVGVPPSNDDEDDVSEVLSDHSSDSDCNVWGPDGPAKVEDDDESIDDDDFFDSDDERKYGAILNPILERNRKKFGTIKPSSLKKRESTAEESDDEEEYDDEDDDNSDAESGSSSGENDDDSDDLNDSDDEDDESEEEDEGFTLLDLVEEQDLAEKEKAAKGKKVSGTDQMKKSKKTINSDSDDESVPSKGKKSTTSSAKTKDPSSDVDSEDDDDEDEEMEDSDSAFSEEEEELLSEAQQAQLKSLISQLSGDNDDDSSSKVKKPRAKFTMEGLDVSEESSAPQSTVDDNSVDLGSLVSSLAGSKSFADVKRKIEKLVGRSLPSESEAGGRKFAPQPMAPPESKVMSQRLDRNEAYKVTSKVVGKRYQDIVTINRQAESISFSAEANQNTRHVASLGALANSYRPSSDFEAQIAAALGASGLGSLPNMSLGPQAKGKTGDHAVLAAERAEIARVQDDLPYAGESADAARALQEKQKALAKMKALLFYDELKRRRANKVKSKTFRRLRKRGDARVGQRELEQLRESDPAAAAELEREQARLAAKERVSLKHTSRSKGIGGSKWIKRVLARGVGGLSAQGDGDAYDQGRRSQAEQVQEFNRRAEELRRRMKRLEGDDDDSDADSDVDSDDDAESEEEAVFGTQSDADIVSKARAELQALKEAKAGDNLPSHKHFKNLMNMKFMQNAVQRAQAKGEQELDAAERALQRLESGLRGTSSVGGLDQWGATSFDEDDEEEEEEEGKETNGKKRTRDTSPSGTSDLTSGRFKVGKSDQTSGGVSASKGKEMSKEQALKHLLGGAKATSLQFAGGDIEVSSESTNSDEDEDEDDDKEETQMPIQIESNPWLSQGISTGISAPPGSSSTTAAEVEASQNPWLANAFVSESLGGRHTASKRAASELSMKGKGSNPTVVAQEASGLTVGDALSALGRQTTRTSDNKHSKKEEQLSLVRTAFSSSVAPSEPSPAAEAHSVESDEDGDVFAEDKLAEMREISEDKAPIRKRGQKKMDQEQGWGAWAGMGADTATLSDMRTAAAKIGDKFSRRALQAAEVLQVAKTIVDPSSTVPSGVSSGPSLMALAGSSHMAAALLAGTGFKRGVTAGSASSFAHKSTADILKGSKRKDAGLVGVFISEKTDKKLLKKHQAAQLPPGVTDVKALHAAMRNPIGPEWNSWDSVAEMTKPEVLTKAGLIIKPVEASSIVNKGSKKGERRGTTVAAGGIHGQADKIKKSR